MLGFFCFYQILYSKSLTTKTYWTPFFLVRKLGMYSMTKMVISTRAPFNILAAENFVEFMGYDFLEILGRSVLLLTKTKSDLNLLQRLIEHSRLSESKEINLALYSKDGYPRNYIVSGELQLQPNSSYSCLLCFQPFRSGITLQEALRERSYPQVLVSADSPFVIVMSNEYFANQHRNTSGRADGKSILSVVNAEYASRLENMIQNAIGGQNLFENQTTFRCTAGKSQTVTCFPVIDRQSEVRYVLLLFPDATSNHLWSAQEHHSTLTSPSSPRHHHPLALPAAARPSFASVVCRNAHTSLEALAITPRIKTPCLNQEPWEFKPVVITSAVLLSLRDRPLPQAARAVGLSATAFKRACRRLGIRRWEYKRGPGRARDNPAAARQGARDDSRPPSAEPRRSSDARPDSPSPGPCSYALSRPGAHLVAPAWPAESECGEDSEERQGGGWVGACSRAGPPDTPSAWMPPEPACPEGDDALVLEMLALPWALNA